MYKYNKNKSLKDCIEEKKRILYLYPMRKERRRSNFDINISFLRKYNLENELGLEEVIIREIAHKFTLWEKQFVLSLNLGYEEFREKVIWLDYDEILELYIEATAHPSVKPFWQSKNNYSFFMNKILPQINNLI